MNKKKSVLLYIGLFLLWVIALPIMLVRFLYKKGILSKKYAILIGIGLSLIWFPIVFSQSGSSGEQSTSTDRQTSGIAAENSSSTIKSLSFNKTDTITVRVGETTKKSYSQYVTVSKKFGETLNPDDVVFISDNPEIATISLLDNSYTSFYYSLTGISAGETTVYASSADGSIVSEKIKVIVPKPIEATSLEVSVEKYDLAIGESIKTSTTILPENTDFKLVSWESSDISVATVTSKGEITAISDGTTTITASLGNGLSSSFDIHVDGNKHLMRLAVTYSREDDNNIGDEWDWDYQLNGEWPPKTIALSAKEKLTLYAKFVEEDDNPDKGDAKKTYTVKEDDLTNGFEVTLEVKVKENGGKNRGQAAHFIVTFSFTPITN